jgi:succinoglycan biosynthesis transport protein ExoP
MERRMAEISETELDVQALAHALWRRAWLLLLLAILAAAAAYAGLSRVQPLYTADTRILIEQRESPLTRTREQEAPAVSEFDESAIQSHVEVLRSREIAEAVIDRLGLERRPEFDPATQPSLLKSLLVMVGLEGHPADEGIRQRVMDSFSERLSVYPLAKSRVIGVDFVAPSPTLAAEVANAVAKAFVDLQQDAKRQSAVAATDWLEQEIARLRDRVAEAEQAVADYRAKNNLFQVSQDGDLSTQQLSDLNAELARAKAARAEAEARSEAVQMLLADSGALERAPEVLDSQLIQRLRERQVALQAQIAELSTTLLPGHPRIRALDGQVRNLSGQIRQEAEKVKAALDTAARVAAAREMSLTASLDAAKSEVSRTNGQDIQLRALEREATAQRQLLESFLGRYREAVARTDANYLPANARIISQAVAPREPSFPKKTVMAIALALAVLLVGCAIVILRELTSGRAFRMVRYRVAPSASGDAEFLAKAGPVPDPKAVDDERLISVADAVAAAAGDPHVTAVSLGEDGTVTAVTLDADEDDMEADASGTQALGEILASPAVRVAVFAGAAGGEGAGEIAFAAARHAARSNLRLILIDVGSKPSPVLGGYERPGLGDLLAGQAAFGEVIRREDDAHVHVISMGASDKNPPLQRLQMVIGALTHTYDKVVVVADQLDAWPDLHVRPDLAAIICGSGTTELLRTELYEAALARGALNALIVRYAQENDDSLDRSASEDDESGDTDERGDAGNSGTAAA